MLADASTSVNNGTAGVYCLGIKNTGPLGITIIGDTYVCRSLPECHTHGANVHLHLVLLLQHDARVLRAL